MPSLILASASPRRRALLQAAGVVFRVQAAAINEDRLPGEAALAYVRRVARQKAQAIQHGENYSLAADTIVDVDGEVFHKPATPAEAAATLRVLSGRSHAVRTAVVLCGPKRIRQFLCTSLVTIRPLSEEDIARYIATGEPFDKAGGYGIQGEGMALVSRVRGSYTNVIGLPLSETLALLRKEGIM